MSDPIYEGVEGLELRLTLLNNRTIFDPSAATYREIRIQKKRSSDEPVVLSGSDVTVGEDSNGDPCLIGVLPAGLEAGYYFVQGYIEDAAGSWPTSIKDFRVHESLG